MCGPRPASMRFEALGMPSRWHGRRMGRVWSSVTRSVCRSPDGAMRSFLTLPQADKIFVVSPTQTTPISSHQQPVQTNQIAFCWSGSKVFVTTGEGKVRLLSYPDLEPVLRLNYRDESKEFTLHGHTSSCLTTELQPTGRYLATGGSDSIIALW